MKLIKNLAIRFSRPNLGCIKWKKTDGKMTCERSPRGLSLSHVRRRQRGATPWRCKIDDAADDLPIRSFLCIRLLIWAYFKGTLWNL